MAVAKNHFPEGLDDLCGDQPCRHVSVIQFCTDLCVKWNLEVDLSSHSLT